MTDFAVPPVVPQQEVPLGEAFSALQQPPAPQPMATPLLTTALPLSVPNVQTVDDVLGSMHANDPIKRGTAAGFITDYSVSQPGGLADAKKHLDTMAMASAVMPEEDSKLWKKYSTTPERMTPEENATLSAQLANVGTTTSGVDPNLRFDPVGKVTRVAASGNVTITYARTTKPGDLDLRPLAPAGVANLRMLANLAPDASGDPPTQDMLAPYLGIDPGHRPNGSAAADLSAAINLLAQERGSTPAQVRAAVKQGWDSINPHVQPWEPKFALGDPNPAQDAMDERLPANVIAALHGGVANLDFTPHGNLSVTTDPMGGLAVNAEPSTHNAKLLRNLYPAFSKDGSTAWLPGEPARTTDVGRMDGDVTSFSEVLLQQLGGHPMFVPGEHVMYDVPAGKKPIETSTDIGPVLSKQPELGLRRLGAADIDPDLFVSDNSPLQTEAWALIPASNTVRASLRQQGFKPIAHKVGDDSHFLVFGITPQQALHHSETIIANKGLYNSDGFLPGEGISFDRPDDGQTSSTSLFSGDVNWHLAGVDREGEAEHASTILDQISTRAQRSVASVDPAVGSLVNLIAQVEQAGGTNLRVYSHRANLPGFSSAWEHLHSDGVSTGSVLTTTPSSAAHAGPVFVRSTDGLVSDAPVQHQNVRQGTTALDMNGVSVLTTEPLKSLTDAKAKWLQVDGNALIPNDEAGDAQLVAGKIKVTDPTPAAARLLALARQAGVPDDKIVAPIPGKLHVSGQMSMTISGTKVPALRRTQPSPDWASRYGIEFDPSWRTAAGVQTLEPRLNEALSKVYEAFVGRHPVASQMWDLSKIGMSGHHSVPAYTEWGKLGGAIGLSSQQWADVPALTKLLADYQKHAVTVPNAPASPAYFLAHELGHVAHGALQFGTDGSGARAELLALRKGAGRDGVVRGLSQQAWTSPEEMVAESVAEGLMVKFPRPMARNVLAILDTAFGRVSSSRKVAPW